MADERSVGRGLFWGIAGGAIMASLVAGIWVASAQPVVISGHATDLSGEQKALKEAKAEAEQARALSRRMEAQARSTAAEADRITVQLAAFSARVKESEADLRAAQARVAIINQLIARQSARLGQQQGPLIRLIAALQSFAGRPPLLSLLQPGDLRDAVHVRAALAHIMPDIQARTAALRGELDRSRRLRGSAAQASAALQNTRTELTRRREALASLELVKRETALTLSSGAAREAERALAMQERARDIDELMSQAKEAGATQTRLAMLPGPTAGPADTGSRPAAARGKSAYLMPVSGTLITGTGELSDSGVRSRGITLAVEPGARIIAPAKGRVVFAGPYGGFGQIVILDHGSGWTTLMTDIARLSVSAGAVADQGAALGVAGSGAHPAITVELRREGRPMDIIALSGVNL